MKAIKSLHDRPTAHSVAPPTTEAEISGPGRRLYHSVRADLLEKLAVEKDSFGLRGLAGQYRMDATRHRKLAGQLELEEVEGEDFTYASKTGRYRGEFGYAWCSDCIKKLDKA